VGGGRRRYPLNLLEVKGPQKEKRRYKHLAPLQKIKRYQCKRDLEKKFLHDLPSQKHVAPLQGGFAPWTVYGC